jgi:hypothetical protein
MITAILLLEGSIMHISGHHDPRIQVLRPAGRTAPDGIQRATLAAAMPPRYSSTK